MNDPCFSLRGRWWYRQQPDELLAASFDSCQRDLKGDYFSKGVGFLEQGGGLCDLAFELITDTNDSFRSVSWLLCKLTYCRNRRCRQLINVDECWKKECV
jgi:hypothetical protein